MGASVIMEQGLLIDILSIKEESFKTVRKSGCSAGFILTGHYCIAAVINE